MLLIFPSTPMTEKASTFLTEEDITHRVIKIPASLDYKTGSDIAIYVDSRDNMDIPMKLSKKHFIVMRVFREFKLEA